MVAVPSVLSASTTITSSAQAALSMAAAMWSASLSVMIVTETFGTLGILPDRHQRNLLHRVEIHPRLVVVQDDAQLVVARLSQVSLRLEDEEVRGRAGGKLPLLGVETPLGELARRPCR